MVQARLAKAKKAVDASMTFLCSNANPVVSKLDLLRTALFPCITYGGEVLGMGKGRVARLEQLWAGAVRRIVGGCPPSRAWASSCALRDERNAGAGLLEISYSTYCGQPPERHLQGAQHLVTVFFPLACIPWHRSSGHSFYLFQG